MSTTVERAEKTLPRLREDRLARQSSLRQQDNVRDTQNKKFIFLKGFVLDSRIYEYLATPIVLVQRCHLDCI